MRKARVVQQPLSRQIDLLAMGVSVENKRVIDRIDYLRQTNARVKFLYCEPLIGALPNMNLENIDWTIVGGEK